MTDSAPLRLMVYDRTCSGHGIMPGLTLTWKLGAKLYGVLDHLDAWSGASSWNEALEWVASYAPERKIAEIQFWGHGRWGMALIDNEPLDVRSLQPDGPHHAVLSRVRGRLAGTDSLWWFRTCETFGMAQGHRFAREWSTFFNCRVAGHTYVIWLAQSGLHELRPGEAPDWPEDEGVPKSGDGPPKKALWSTPFTRNTVSCFASRVPSRR